MAGPDHLGGKTVVVELIRTLGLVGEVEVRGRVSGADKQALLTESRGYLHPSRWESCSITLLEFLSAGTPCLASDSIHATNALAPSEVLIAADFESGRPEAARTVLAELDKNSALGTRARNWATESGSWPAVGRKYASLLDKTAKALAS
jgi:glycosyltransferase involved in cell wall biosynthesis